MIKKEVRCFGKICNEKVIDNNKKSIYEKIYNLFIQIDNYELLFKDFLSIEFPKIKNFEFSKQNFIRFLESNNFYSFIELIDSFLEKKDIYIPYISNKFNKNFISCYEFSKNNNLLVFKHSLDFEIGLFYNNNYELLNLEFSIDEDYFDENIFNINNCSFDVFEHPFNFISINDISLLSNFVEYGLFSVYSNPEKSLPILDKIYLILNNSFICQVIIHNSYFEIITPFDIFTLQHNSSLLELFYKIQMNFDKNNMILFIGEILSSLNTDFINEELISNFKESFTI
jgi:hypothetical protein